MTPGDWKEDQQSGSGSFSWRSGAQYEGEVDNGLRNGFGKNTFVSGDVYEGQFVRDKRSGNGTYFWKDGRKYVGEFQVSISQTVLDNNSIWKSLSVLECKFFILKYFLIPSPRNIFSRKPLNMITNSFISRLLWSDRIVPINCWQDITNNWSLLRVG